ncbi:MAG: efflux RND transporter periplasmic adaptor subunit [Chthoniobacterales bacterium]
MQNHKHILICGAALAFLTLAACGKKETSAEKSETEAPAGKHDDNVVTLTAKNLEHIDLKIEPVTLGSIGKTLKAAGAVSANMNKTAKIVSTLEGRLMQMNVDLNDRVKTGQVLGLVQTPELLGKALELKAPIDGVIIERKATVGELVGKETVIYTISDPTDLWVIAEIKERDIGAVKVGQETTFSVLAYPGEKFRGKIVRLGDVVEPESRTLEARIETSNTDGRLKPGMFADVSITTTVLENALVIPDKSLETDGENQIVFVSLGENRFEKRVVELGLEAEGRTQILGGIKAGEKIVTEGGFILKSEQLKGELGEE